MTHEILRWPDVDDYDVRVSVAEIVKAGFIAVPEILDELPLMTANLV